MRVFTAQGYSIRQGVWSGRNRGAAGGGQAMVRKVRYSPAIDMGKVILWRVGTDKKETHTPSGKRRLGRMAIGLLASGG
jgi:hypothetical protein